MLVHRLKVSYHMTAGLLTSTMQDLEQLRQVGDNHDKPIEVSPIHYIVCCTLQLVHRVLLLISSEVSSWHCTAVLADFRVLSWHCTAVLAANYLPAVLCSNYNFESLCALIVAFFGVSDTSAVLCVSA